MTGELLRRFAKAGEGLSVSCGNCAALGNGAVAIAEEAFAAIALVQEQVSPLAHSTAATDLLAQLLEMKEPFLAALQSDTPPAHPTELFATTTNALEALLTPQGSEGHLLIAH